MHSVCQSLAGPQDHALSGTPKTTYAKSPSPPAPPPVAETPRLIWKRIANPDTSTVYVGVPLAASCCLRATRMQLRWSILILTATAPVLIGVSTGRACAQTPGTAWYEAFEGPHTSWQPASATVSYRTDLHQRIQGEAHTGQGCERLRITGSGQGAVYFVHDVGRPRVIDELIPTLWIKSDRPGIQFIVRIVLPRSRDPRTGRPLVALLVDNSYARIGSWQQLRLDNVPQRLAWQARTLQSQLRVNVDVQEAYVEGVLLNVYGGPGTTNLWIDDLDIGGYVATADRGTARANGLQTAPANPPIGAHGVAGAMPAAVMPAAVPLGTGPASQVKMEGSILVASGRPLFPRLIQYQGEPLTFLKQLGFNGIWLAQTPTAELVQEADRQGLWIVSPPPIPPTPPADASSAAIGAGFQRVLAWDIGSRLTGEQVEATRQWAELVRAADRRNGRPLICRPENELWSYSHFANPLVIGRSPVGTSLEMADYGTWVRERPRLARPGTPVWTSVQTQPAATLREQWAILGRGEAPPGAVANEQLRLLVYTAITAGSRGLIFESDSRLDLQDADTRSRAMALELLNLELDLVEPWAAAGQFVAAVPGSLPEVVAAMLRTERARLLVPIWSARGAQFVSGQAAAHGVSFVVPGVPESNRAYELTPGGLRPIHHRQATGGMSVTLDEFGLTSLVLLTQDPLIHNSLTKRAREIGPRAAELQRSLAADKLRMVEQVHARLASRFPVPQAAEWIATAKKSLQSCDGSLAIKDAAGAYAHANRAMRPLRVLERVDWEAAVGRLRWPVASPAAVSFRTLPWHVAMMDFIANARPGPNQLPGGDFDDLSAMLQSGWRHFQHSVSGVRGECDLSPAAAHSGRLGLRLAAQAADRQSASILVESPPVWMNSPEVAVAPGSLVRIQGWVQVPAPITGSVDGLLILDSITGEPLAARIDETTGWMQFTFYRVAHPSGRVSLTFALSGLGEAWIDDVTIQQLGAGGPEQQPDPRPIPRMQAPADSGRGPR